MKRTVEEDGDEDVDFNLFLQETLSPETSLSLGSEIDGLDGEVDSQGKTFDNSLGVNSLKPTSEVQNSAVGDSVSRTPKKRKSCSNSQPKADTVQTKDNVSESDYIDVLVGDLSNTAQSQKPVIDLENEDAVCTRTRACYSLASFTLDELKTFLQETDDDDDFQDVGDEEEYRKFLAAVLNSGDGDGQSNQGNENVDDEDEDNDADFEIEIQELLESDVDESTRDKTQKDYGGAGWRQRLGRAGAKKNSTQYKKKLSGQEKRPLRPLLPVLQNGPTAIFPTNCGKTLMPHSCAAEDFSINGFTLHQIGQLHCLIHEHVQLLIQVFSVCVLDSSQQHIACQVQGLIFEMLKKHNEVLAWNSVPYPSICFYPPYVCSSVPDEYPRVAPAQCSLESFPPFNTQRVRSPVNNQMLASQDKYPSKGRCVHVFNEQVGSFQNIQDSFWVSLISGPMLSILDVALNIVGRYMDDVYTASQQFPKKTMAAALVESTKKISVALVPKEIVKLAQRFFPFFNPSLFPHKPSSAAVVNRVLFTDAEDELLVLGLMEYNTDWKAIQQRFLPCKSRHQAKESLLI